jgi:hypothetical protein
VTVTAHESASHPASTATCVDTISVPPGSLLRCGLGPGSTHASKRDASRSVILAPGPKMGRRTVSSRRNIHRDPEESDAALRGPGARECDSHLTAGTGRQPVALRRTGGCRAARPGLGGGLLLKGPEAPSGRHNGSSPRARSCFLPPCVERAQPGRYPQRRQPSVVNTPEATQSYIGSWLRTAVSERAIASAGVGRPLTAPGIYASRPLAGCKKAG